MNDETRIAHVGKYYPPHMGGIETHLQNLCRALANTSRVYAIVANDLSRTTREMDGKVEVCRVGTHVVMSGTPICLGLPSAIRRTNAELVHVHLPNPWAVIALRLSGYTGPVIATYHSDVVRQKRLARALKPLQNWILGRSSAIVCTSQRYLDSSEPLQQFREKCIVIPYGIPDTGQSKVTPERIAAIRQRHGNNLVLAVGRLVYYKGFEVLIKAMSAVHGKLLLIGDGPLRPILQKRITELGLQSKVALLGEVSNDELAPYYRACDVFAFPSIARSEAFGIVQLEAMANGLPVVNTDLESGVPSVSRHNETGLTVAPQDAPALATALNRLLSDRALAARFADVARRRVRAEFTSEIMSLRMRNLYAEVLSESVRGRQRVTPAAVTSGSDLPPLAMPGLAATKVIGR